MNRRGFMGSILALGAAPAIVRIVPTDTTLEVVSGFNRLLINRRYDAEFISGTMSRIRLSNHYGVVE